MRKYIAGEPIRDLNHLLECDFIFFHNKCYHKGWWGNWSLRFIKHQLLFGNIRYAVPNKPLKRGDNNE